MAMAGLRTVRLADRESDTGERVAANGSGSNQAAQHETVVGSAGPTVPTLLPSQQQIAVNAIAGLSNRPLSIIVSP